MSRYLVIGLIGRGGMGEVYAAYDPELDRKVALKLLRAQANASVDPSEGRARLLREAQAIARLSDPNVVMVFDVGTFADRVFLAMEYVDGSTLGYWLHAQPRSWREVVTAFVAAGRGLASAHRAGVVHRDFKPDNVMISKDGKVRVMDFGLARSIGSPRPPDGPSNRPTEGEGTSTSGTHEVGERDALSSSARRLARRLLSTPVRHAAGPPRSAVAGELEVATVDLSVRRANPRATGLPSVTPAAAPTRMAPIWREGDSETRNLSRAVEGFGTDPAMSALDAPLTVTGTLMGTPAYMAPEQFRGGEVDARTDQFSFCAALYEALYGERPFPGKSIHDLTTSVLAGQVRPAGPGARVPGWLRRTLLRGLRVEPAARHPSMESLLERLGRDPMRARRRWAAAAAVSGLIVLLGVGLLRAQRAQRMICGSAEATLADVWELPGAAARRFPRKQAIRSKFLATGRPYAADSFTAVSQVLDRYVVAWNDMHRESCEATYVRGEQSADVLDLRGRCLHDRLSEVRALTDVFNDANGDTVTKSLQAAQGIRPVADCADVAALRAVVRPPDDPAVQGAVAEVRSELARLKAQAAAGRYRGTEKAMASAVAKARLTKYEPVMAEALLEVGALQTEMADGVSAERSLEEAVWLAEASHHDEVLLAAEVFLVYALGTGQSRYTESERWARHAGAVLKRLGPGHDVMAGWLANNLGGTYNREGKHEEALAMHLEALRLKRAALGGWNFDSAISEGNVALSLFELGRVDEAIARNDLALKVMAGTVGLEHPSAAGPLINGAEFLTARGQYLQARTMAQGGLAIMQRQFAPDNSLLAYPLTEIGRSYVEGEQPALALYALEWANRLREREDPGEAARADTRFLLARALWESGLDATRGIALAEKALAEYRLAPSYRRKAEDTERWLETHGTHSRSSASR